MIFSDPAATVKWPNVPACYDWLYFDPARPLALEG
jgi:hypothetical protein